MVSTDDELLVCGYGAYCYPKVLPILDISGGRLKVTKESGPNKSYQSTPERLLYLLFRGAKRGNTKRGGEGC